MNEISQEFQILKIFGEVISFFWWIILPLCFYPIFKILWVDFVAFYSANSWNASQEWIFLEAIPPRDIERSPKIMENFFTGLTGVLTTYNTFDEYLKGAFWHDRFSMELVSEEGRIHFYVRAQKKYRNMVEAQLYAQYPDIEILETEDYYKNFPKIIPNKNWDLWGTDFELVSDDPIPIKTYDKFEEMVTGETIDPMAAITEVLGKLGPGQHLWLQLVLQPLPEANKKKYDAVIKKLKGEPVIAPKGIWESIIELFSVFFRAFWGPVEFGSVEKKDLQPLEFRLSPGEKELLKATEENLGKNIFKTKMRMIYLGRRENFDRSFVGAFIGALKQFNDIGFNQIKPEDISKTYGIIFAKEKRADFRKRKIYDRYRRRNMDGKNIVFSTKELATIFHFPDMNVKTPAIPRVASKLGSAPINLPVE